PPRVRQLQGGGEQRRGIHTPKLPDQHHHPPTHSPTPNSERPFLLPKSVLTSVGFVSLRELLAEPGPHAVRLPAINIAASAAPLLRIILFIGYLLASSSYAIDISLYCHHFSAAIKYICDIDYAHRTSFCGTRQPCITPMVALTSKSRYNTIDYAMQEIP
ncbi:hypothetical protein, partial [Bifidobacterium longum]|uniref:hypothetical protein n=1 Tax=Bifidobacterium longum TaxID=216816 RepID=UPI0025554A61